MNWHPDDEQSNNDQRRDEWLMLFCNILDAGQKLSVDECIRRADDVQNHLNKRDWNE